MMNYQFYIIRVFFFNKGSRNGVVKLWKCGNSFRSLTPLFEINIDGFINSMVFTPDGKNLIVGVGQEHKCGRWWRIKETKNKIVVIPLIQTSLKDK